MILNVKALAIVLALAIPTFWLCRRIAVEFMQDATFRRRRNVWLALTVAAFLSPDFWLWAAVAIVLLAWAGRRDANPLGLYCLVAFAAPPVSFAIPAPLINQLFDLSPYRILSIAVLIPAILSGRTSNPRLKAFSQLDLVMLAFVGLQVVLLVPFESVTNTLRRSLLLVLDIVVVVYAFQRLDTKAKVADTVACVWLAAAVMAPIALVESARGWLLYTGITEQWGDPNIFAYLMRGTELRAQVAAGHSILFGFHVAIGLGAYLYLRSRARPPAFVDWTILAMLAAAILVSYSRGAWVTALGIAVGFAFLRPDAAKRAPAAVALGLAGLVLLLLTPLKEKVFDRLPFIGTDAQDTVAYRQYLADTSWALVNQHPFFGDPTVVSKLQGLKQGQGIIDIVNGYLATALFSGYVGMVLQAGILVVPMFFAWRATRAASKLDADTRLLAAALVACMLGTLVFIATAAYHTNAYVLGGLMFSIAAVSMSRVASAGAHSTSPRAIRPAVTS